MQLVKDILTNDNSFFSQFETEYATLYETLFDETESSILDMELLTVCGERFASPVLVHQTLDKVVAFIVTRYGYNWTKIKDVVNGNYNALQPYNLSQTTVGEKTGTNETTSSSEDTTKVVAYDSTTGVESDIDINSNEVNVSQSENNETTVTTVGNTGSLSYSTLIKNEIETRRESLMSLIINDIKYQLTLDIY